MRWSLVVVLASTHAAWAQRPEVAPDVANARQLAREGRCVAFSRVARRIERLDPDYYAQLVHDPEVAPCFDDGDDRPGSATAIAISLGTTLAGAGMLAVAASLDSTSSGQKPLAITGGLTFALGPTTGHMYAGELWSPGLGVRLGSLALGGAGLALVARCEDTCHGSNSQELGVILLYAGALAYTGATFYEIIDAGRAASDHDKSLAITPTPGGAALTLGGRF